MHYELIVLLILAINSLCNQLCESYHRNPKKPKSPGNSPRYGQAPYDQEANMIESSKFEPPSRPLLSSSTALFTPYFDPENQDNVTSQLGKTAHLHCKIRQLADRTVSWVRQRDLHILTSGSYTYTSDQRFTCIHLDNSDDWTLEIKYVQKEDAGVYECQVSTEPKMSLSIRLSVIVAKAIVPEGPELVVESGATIRLTCIIHESSSHSLFMFWYREGTVLNYDSPRGGIKVTTERGSSTVSRLEIADARFSDSGDYSCKPSFADFTNVTVHVSEGENLKQNSELKEVLYHQHQADSDHSQVSDSSHLCIACSTVYIKIILDILLCMKILYD